jgi:hypothetical protein
MAMQLVKVWLQWLTLTAMVFCQLCQQQALHSVPPSLKCMMMMGKALRTVVYAALHAHVQTAEMAPRSKRQYIIDCILILV